MYSLEILFSPKNNCMCVRLALPGILAACLLFSCGAPDTWQSKVAVNGVAELSADAVSSAHVHGGEAVAPHALVALLRADLPSFGCWLEKGFAYRDERFNCSTRHYTNLGDPCDRLEEYYEKIDFPEALCRHIHPDIRDIDVQFEHGVLQELTVVFSKPIPRTAIDKMLGLQSDRMPSNVVFIEYYELQGMSERVTIIGFEASGGIDVEC